MPRSTLDLVAELHARAEGLTAVALAIGFERDTEFVFAHQAPSDALATLNAAIARGGEPMGFIGFGQDVPGCGHLLAQPLEEYAEEEWVEKYLYSLVGEFRRLVTNRTLF